MKYKIYLASQSPRRKSILKKLGFKLTVIPAHIKEAFIPGIPAQTQAIKLALKKANAVSHKVKNGLIIAADTIVMLNNKIIGKPRNVSHAKKILRTLNDSCHYVITAIAVIEMPQQKQIVDFEKTTVYTRRLPLKKLDQFAKIHLDKAGGYAIQENDIFIKKICGDFSNVVGLPEKRLQKILKHFNYE
ncbi:MAG: Maf family protein [Candidatus Omnitrophota bacterium]